MITASAVALASMLAQASPSTVAPPPACPTAQDSPDVGQLVARTEAMMKGGTSKSTMEMTIKTPSFTRKLKLKTMTKGDDYALVRIVEGGPRETGMMTLKREKQLWNYLPQAGRVMKLPSGMLGDSWMGSDFTNDDLVQGTSLSKDFTATASPIDVDGKKAWHVVLTPTKTAVVVWGKIELDVDRATCTPISERFFDEDNKLARKMTFSNFKQVGWRTMAMTMTVAPGTPGRETTVQYDDIAFDVDVPDDTFTVHRLEQGR
ncbi:MAG TPA: outer membrane lipoprotein-sorting protein [Myxococcota bacterium]